METREIMTRDVVTFAPEMSIPEAQDALLHYRIHGAPVVDNAGQLVGMVSFTDLSARPGRTVREVMTPEPITVGEDTPVEDVAALMLDQMVRRVPVVEGGRVIGIVSASGVIQLFLNLHERPRHRVETVAAAAPHGVRGPIRKVPRPAVGAGRRRGEGRQ